MPVDIVPGEFCATYFGSYDVPGSRPGVTYHVVHDGGEGPASCDCPAFKYFKGAVYDRTCKHIEYVWKHACMWNCQWFEGNPNPTLVPTHINRPVLPNSHCPNCGGPTVGVRIAV